MVNGLLDKVGFRWTLRIWAIGMAVVAGLALLGVKPRVPVPRYHRGQNRPRLIPVQMHFLKRPLFWTFVSTCSYTKQNQFTLLSGSPIVHYNRSAGTVLLPSFSLYRYLYEVDIFPTLGHYRAIIIQLFWCARTNTDRPSHGSVAIPVDHVL